DELSLKGDTASIRSLYFKIVEILAKIQTSLFDKIDFSFCYQRETFDRENMLFDVAKFEEYFLQKFYKKYDPETFSKFKNYAIEVVLQQPNDFFFYRDFQSRNFMIKDDKLYFIDFQSGRKGALQYDLASFIYSSGTINYEGMQEELIDHYLVSLRKYAKIDEDNFKNTLPAFGVIRLMQAMGNYAFYFYTRDDKSIYDKIPTNLVQIKVLAEKMGVDCGIY
ncbi:MAG: phosphotransferase, partial [Candidatus Delongbacteria bacterium]|nr:phosphotransferase [Candidatus Delongbacteria bacterium]